MIIALLLAQTGMLTLIGIVVGSVLSVVLLRAAGDPSPGFVFISALGLLTLITALLAAVIPATIASRREPIRELRVP